MDDILTAETPVDFGTACISDHVATQFIPVFFFSLYLRFKPDVRFESGVHGFSPDGFPQQ